VRDDAIVAKLITPEERHLGEQEARLAQLAEQLADREAELAEADAAYSRFVAAVGRRIANLLAERARLEFEIARLLAQRAPSDQDLAAWRDLKGRDSDKMASTRRSLVPDGEATRDEDDGEHAREDPEMKALFRASAKRFHPDLATGERDRERRTMLMAELNRLYAAGEANGIRRMLEREEMAPEAVAGDGIGARLIRVLRQIAQVEARLEAIDTALAALRERPLWSFHEEARAEYAFIDQVESSLRFEIREKRLELEALEAVA
jgi:hypothetical protein